MKKLVVRVKNVESLALHFTNLEARDPGVPGIMTVHGNSGAGKTTAVHWLAGAKRAVWIRANALWTPRTFVSKLVEELEGEQDGSSSDMLDWVAQKLAETERPVFIDEADYLVADKKLIESVRDLHDATNVPLIMIGMADFQKAIQKRPQLAGRVSQRIVFEDIDLDDARLTVRQLSDVAIAEDLIVRMKERARGSMRQLIVALSMVEQHCKQIRATEMDLSRWGNRQLTTGEE